MSLARSTSRLTASEPTSAESAEPTVHHLRASCPFERDEALPCSRGVGARHNHCSMGCDARTAGEHPGTPLSRLDPGVDDIALGTRGKSEIFAIAVALSHGPIVNIVPGPYASTNGVHRLGERATTGTGHPVLHRLTGHPESLCDLGTSHEIGNEANDAQPLHLQLRHRSTRSVLERAPLADHRHEVVPRVISPGSSVELVDELIDERIGNGLNMKGHLEQHSPIPSAVARSETIRCPRARPLHAHE